MLKLSGESTGARADMGDIFVGNMNNESKMRFRQGEGDESRVKFTGQSTRDEGKYADADGCR
jgi:hypothetical protein